MKTNCKNRVCQLLNIELIPLTRGKYAIVDKKDYKKLMLYSWYACYDKRINTWYVAKGNKPHQMHRFILKDFLVDGKQIDHINHNGLDNRRKNIRICTNSQNQMNKKKRLGTTSKYKGVYWFKRANKWMAKIKLMGQWFYLGLHKNEKLAALAYNESAKKLFGEFALLNKVDIK